MLRPLTIGLILVLCVATPAPGAGAEDIAVLVEQTTTPEAPLRFVLSASAPGPVTVRALRLKDPEPVLATPAPLSQQQLDWLTDGPLAKRKDLRVAARTLRRQAAPAEVISTVVHVKKALRREHFEIRLPFAGLYVIEVTTASGLKARASALVSRLGLVTKRHPEGVLVWAVDRTSGKPWADVPVRLMDANGKPLHKTRTDANGLADIRREGSPTLRVIAAAEAHMAFGDETWFPAHVDDRRVFLFPHQPAYRPGEAIAVKGILRAIQDGRLHMDAAVESVAVTLLDARAKVVGEKTAPVRTDLGTFDTRFDLAAGAPTGTYRVVARIGDDEYETAVRVEAYRKPAFEVRVEPRTPRILAGETSAMTVQAAFYDGGPLAGARVDWEVFHNRIDRGLFPTEDLVRLFYGTERQAYEPRSLVKGVGELDADGRLVVKVRAPEKAEDGWLSVRATVRGPGRIHVTGGGGCAVAAAPMRIALQSDKNLYGPEDIAGVDVRIERADGRPAAGLKGALHAAQAGRRGERRRPKLVRAFTTDAQGRAHVEVPLVGEGVYVLHAIVPPAEGSTEGPLASKPLRIWVAADQPTVGQAPTDLQVTIDRDTYAPGETARILVRAPNGPAILAALEGPILLRSAVLRTAGVGATIWSVPINAEHAPNVFVTFALVRHGALSVVTRMLRIPPAQKLLHADIEPDDDVIAPGSLSGATVRVRDADGNPVPGAEVTLAVVDDALHGLFPAPVANIEAFFHPTRRNSVSTTDLLHHASAGIGRRAAPAGSVGGGQFRAPSGSVPPGMREPSDATPPPPSAPAPTPNSPAAGQPAEEDGEAEAEVEEAEESEGLADGVSAGRSGGRGGGKARRRKGISARKDFRSSVYWAPALRTGPDGSVRVDGIRYADSLTRWRLSATTIDAATRVGRGEARVVARKQISVRGTAPRFLRAGDTVALPTLIRNRTRHTIQSRWTSRLEAGAPTVETGAALTLDAGAHVVQTMRVRLERPGEARWKTQVQGQAGGDAEEHRFPVHPQGIERKLGQTTLSREGRATARIELPQGAVDGTARCRVQVEPGAVAAVASALPYLASYPHGCTEQTMSRFLPVLAAAEAADALGIPRRGLLAEVPQMIDAGVKRLRVLRHADGAFGWWPGDASDPVMTALVLRGLARVEALRPEDAGVKAMRMAAAGWLVNQMQAGGKRRRPLTPVDRAALLLALAETKSLPDGVFAAELRQQPQGVARPLRMALLLQAAHAAGLPEAVRSLRTDLEIRVSRGPGTASWAARRPAGGGESPTSWREDPIETTAEAALALLRAGADHALLADAAAWLMANRPGGSHWRSTRDTATAVRFLSAFAVATQDVGAPMVVEATWDGQGIGQVTISRDALFTDAAAIEVPASLLRPGAAGTLVLTGFGGSFHAAVALSFFETGPAIRADDSGLEITRRWYTLTPRQEAGGVIWQRTPLTETVPSGTLIECELEVSSSRAQEYVMITDPHAGGFEPAREVGMRVPGRHEVARSEIERYDDRTVFFVSHLPAHPIRLRHIVRATHVGSFTALPAQAELMYFPEVRGNSNGEVLEITDAGPPGADTKGGAR